MSALPDRLVVAGVELPRDAQGEYCARLGEFELRVLTTTIDGNALWSWRLDAIGPGIGGHVEACGIWDTPEEAAENAERVIGLFASLPRGATA